MTAENRNVPEGLHLAIIPDGNRRWARAKNRKPWEGHAEGLETFRGLLRWAHADSRVAVLTIWGLSTENWKRSQAEIKQLMKLFEDFLRAEREEFQKNQSRFVHAGRKDRIPASLAQLIEDVEEETRGFTDFTLQFALDYGGQDEMIRAIKKIDPTKKITEEVVRAALDHPEVPDIDLIIRTSGEQRLSNFFLWQGAYAELAFIDVFFPDLTPNTLQSIVDDFTVRERRFGK